MAAMPSPTSGHEEHAILVSQCLDFCQTMAGKSLTFSFSLTLPTGFSFSVDTMGKGALASQKTTKKKPTPSTMRRNARRREEFLKKKVNASTDDKSQSEPVSVEEAEVPPSVLHHHPSPSPSSERRQVITVGREKARPTFSQLDGDPPSSLEAEKQEMDKPQAEKVFRCAYKRCDATFASRDEQLNHGKDTAKIPWGMVKSMHSGPMRNSEEEGLD